MPVLADIMPTGVRLVFVGEAVGEASARCGHYYADPNNSFWEDLHSAGLTPERLSPYQDAELPQYGIGLTDVVKDLTDPELKCATRSVSQWNRWVQDLEQRMSAVGPAYVCVNGLGLAPVVLARECDVGYQGMRFAGAEVWVMDSTSGLARGYRDRRLMVLRRLAQRLNRPHG